jgi:hypothetical protein
MTTIKANKQDSSYNSLLDEMKTAQVPRLNSKEDKGKIQVILN